MFIKIPKRRRSATKGPDRRAAPYPRTADTRHTMMSHTAATASRRRRAESGAHPTERKERREEEHDDQVLWRSVRSRATAVVGDDAQEEGAKESVNTNPFRRQR